MKKLHLTLACLAYTTCLSQAHANEPDLLSLSLRELTNIEVTSVSKKSEKASEAAAAIFVLTSEDIKRLGATSIPEALRVVPGINVAQSGSHQWAVTSRGFNGQFANKLLVLIDGRSVYTPLFSGVWWDAQDVVLEDIERIEVIRGPGGTLWGANAVNGVINIITKKATDTQGTLVSLTAGNYENASTTVRQGMQLGENAHMRVYAKYNNRDEFKTLTNADAGDAWKKYQTGFRADWKQGEASDITLQGDIYSISENFRWNLPSVATPPIQVSQQDKQPHGGNLLGRWHYANSPQSDITLQAYYDREVRDNLAYGVFDTYDLDFQHVWTGLDRHEIIWGAGYRLVKEDLENTLYYTASPNNRSDSLFSAFVQDKFALSPNELFLTLGSKFEHNDYTGFEYQPTARLTWLINEKQTLWGAVSRAVHTPNMFTEDGQLLFSYYPGPPATGFAASQSNPLLKAESEIAYELGYRVEVTPRFYVDTAAFYNDYNDLFRAEAGSGYVQTTGPFAPYFVAQVPVRNTNSGRSFGFEATANWDVMNNWQLAAGYSFIDMKLAQPVDVAFSFTGKQPEQQFNLRSNLVLPYDVELNNTVYLVDSLPGIRVPDYVRFDARLAWMASEGVELSLVGQNLLDPQHPEFEGFVYQSGSQVPRSVYGNVTLRF